MAITADSSAFETAEPFPQYASSTNTTAMRDIRSYTLRQINYIQGKHQKFGKAVKILGNCKVRPESFKRELLDLHTCELIMSDNETCPMLGY